MFPLVARPFSRSPSGSETQLISQGLRFGLTAQPVSRGLPSDLLVLAPSTLQRAPAAKIASKNLFQLSAEEKLKVWQDIASRLADAPDAIVSFDATGKISIDTSTPSRDSRHLSRTPDENPLLKALKKLAQQKVYANTHFTVIKSLRHTYENPRLLILPNPRPRANYRDLKDFLSPNRATDEEKISLLDCMHTLLKYIPPSSKNLANLFHANVGRYSEIPYLHIHYIPINDPFRPSFQPDQPLRADVDKQVHPV